jgi:hypothetical protein
MRQHRRNYCHPMHKRWSTVAHGWRHDAMAIVRARVLHIWLTESWEDFLQRFGPEWGQGSPYPVRQKCRQVVRSLFYLCMSSAWKVTMLSTSKLPWGCGSIKGQLRGSTTVWHESILFTSGCKILSYSAYDGAFKDSKRYLFGQVESDNGVNKYKHKTWQLHERFQELSAVVQIQRAVRLRFTFLIAFLFSLIIVCCVSTR